MAEIIKSVCEEACPGCVVGGGYEGTVFNLSNLGFLVRRIPGQGLEIKCKKEKVIKGEYVVNIYKLPAYLEAERPEAPRCRSGPKWAK